MRRQAQTNQRDDPLHMPALLAYISITVNIALPFSYLHYNTKPEDNISNKTIICIGRYWAATHSTFSLYEQTAGVKLGLFVASSRGERAGRHGSTGAGWWGPPQLGCPVTCLGSFPQWLPGIVILIVTGTVSALLRDQLMASMLLPARLPEPTFTCFFFQGRLSPDLAA